MFFTSRDAKLLQDGGHLFVDGCPGLRLVARGGMHSWVYRYKDDAGRMKQIGLGKWPAMALHEATAAWAELKGERSKGIDPVREKKAQRNFSESGVTPERKYTVRDLVNDFCAGHLRENRSDASYKAAESLFNRVFDDAPDFAAQEANTVTRKDAYALLDSRRDTPTATIKLRGLLGAAWAFGLDSGNLDGTALNWWREVMQGRLKSKGKVMGGEHVGRTSRVLSEAEVGVLLGWVHNMHSVGRDTVIMQLWTCLRGGEVLAMTPDQLSEEGEILWLTIPKAKTKNARFENAKDHRTPLFGRARAIVEERVKNLGQSGFLFEGTLGCQYQQKTFSTYIYTLQPHSNKVQMRQGDGLVCPVVGWSPHDLRRTGRTMLADAGCPNEVAESILGHMPAGIVGVYNLSKYDAERVKWLSVLSQRLEALCSAQTLLPRLP